MGGLFIYAVLNGSGNTRVTGLDKNTNMELIFKHIRENGEKETPLRELQQVLPAHNRRQIQSLLNKLRKENRIYCVGRTSAAKWFVVGDIDSTID